MNQVKSVVKGVYGKSAVAAGLLVAASQSFAVGVDVSSVTSALTDAAVTVGVVGAAALAVVVVVKVFKYIRGAF